MPTPRYAHSLHLPKRYWASLRCTSRCLFAKNAFEWIEQLLAVQDVVRTHPRPHSRGEIGPGFLFGGHTLDSLRNRQTGCRCFGYERPAASPGSRGSCLLLFLNRSSQSHRTPPIRRPTAYISDSAFTRRAQREGYLMCHSKARSGPGCCCRRRAERVRSFAESARPDCRAVPFPLDRDCHHRAQCAARCNR